jgi:hypothetical protein
MSAPGVKNAISSLASFANGIERDASISCGIGRSRRAVARGGAGNIAKFTTVRRPLWAFPQPRYVCHGRRYPFAIQPSRTGPHDENESKTPKSEICNSGCLDFIGVGARVEPYIRKTKGKFPIIPLLSGPA